MGQAEIKIFIFLAGLTVLVFITGIIIFLSQYRKRKLVHELEKRQINEQHQLDLLNTQLESQRQTMQFIGQEIHDSAAQKITLASIYTQQMEFAAAGIPEKENLAGVNKILNDALLELRLLSKNLTDQKLQLASLEELVSMECEQVNATHICRATCNIGPLPVIGIATKSSLLRVLQEFIQNSIKHSGCSNIHVKLIAVSNDLCMTMSDDGKGFDKDGEQRNGVGLDSIRRRIQSLGGKFNFESEVNKGVHLHLSVPLQHTENSGT